jgi:hypothetical protein
MRYYSWLLWVVMAFVGTLVLGCDPATLEKKPSTGVSFPPSLPAPTPPQPTKQQPSSSDSPPLLLLDEAPRTDAAGKSAIDNGRCLVCHVNFVQEHLTMGHAKAGVGCAECHGPSDAHIADESWASGGNGTAPDIMYPPEKIDSSCMACHKMDKRVSKKHAAYLSGELKDRKFCIDCHGSHRMAIRRCKWK